jgi:LacI family transcriptional regulator
MATPLHVALMLDLDQLYKRHYGIFAGVQQYAQEHGWETIIDECPDLTLSSCSRENLPYQGIIGRATDRVVRQAQRLNLPVVNTWFSSPVWNQLPSVFSDWSGIGRLQAEHLLARNYRRFAGLSLANERSVLFQINEFASTVNAVGCPCVKAEIPLSPTSSAKNWQAAERTMVKWMDEWEIPIGVFVGRESAGRIVAQMCRTRGWRVPQDVAIIAGQNEELICTSLRPTLSSVEIGYDRIGYESARLLHRLMTGQAPPSEPILLPAQGIVVRESTDAVAVDDELMATALNFIAANCHRDIAADDVAYAAKTHPRTLQRRFRKYLNRSISEEIRSVRIEHAKRSLTQTLLPIGQIARESGFGTAAQMSALFRRELKTSPKQYRLDRQAASK